jgi:hypothetical protein
MKCRSYNEVEKLQIFQEFNLLFLLQGCQISLGTIVYQNVEKIPNYHKICRMAENTYVDQMSIKYTNIFQCKTLQMLPKLEFLV